MSLSQMINCSICERRNLTETANQWCPVCDEYLCSACSNYHKFAKLSMDHKTTDIPTAEELQSIFRIKTICETHNKKLEYFCSNHDVSFCISCTPDHKTCGHFQTLCDLKRTQNAAIIVEFNQLLSTLKNILSQLKSSRTANLTDLNGQYMDCKKHIKDIRLEVNSKLDEIEANILNEIVCMYTKSNSILNDIVEKIEKHEQQIDKIQKDFEIMKRYGSDDQLFLGVKEFTRELSLLVNSVKQLTKKDEMEIFEIVFTMTPNCSFSALEESFGLVQLIRKPWDISFRTQVDIQMQLLNPVYDIEKISLKRRMDTDLSDIVKGAIWGCCYADDGSILITNHHSSCVIVLKGDGTFIRNINLENKPNKIVFTKGNIYVSSHVSKTLTSIDFAEGNIIKSVNFNDTCDALALADDRIIINIVEKEYRILDLDLNQVGCIPIKTKMAYHLAHYNGQIYYAKNIIYCFDLSGQMMWKLQDENLTNVEACCVDGRGNIFIAGPQTNKIFIVSPDGKKWKTAVELKTMKSAVALYFDRHQNCLLVISDATSRVQEYDVQY